MEKKKVLLIGAHSRHPYKVGMLAEIFKNLYDDKNNDLRFLDCDNALGGYCVLNKAHGRIYCKKCTVANKCVMEWINFPKEQVIKMKKFKAPKFPVFAEMEDLKKYKIDDQNAGLSVVTSIMSMTRDYQFNPLKHKKDIQGFLRTEYITIKNLEEIYEKFPFEELHTFNGRFAFSYAAVQFARKKGVDFYLYEGSGKPTKYLRVKNNFLHNMNMFRDLIDKTWVDAPAENRDNIAKNWFVQKRGGKNFDSFTIDQKNKLLPKDYDASKENIVMFNSSIDEYYAFDDFTNPIEKNENDIVKSILEKYKDDDSKHFYLRIHPNLTEAKRKKALQIKQINELKKKNYKNFTIIEPDAKIDSYSMIDIADKVITFISTMGVESTFWGKPSILAGQAYCDRLGCVYQVKSYDELFEMIDKKDLQPIEQSKTYPYGYGMAMFGEEYKTYIPYRHNDGEFLGHSVKIFENPINEFIKGHILHRFKVVKTEKKEKMKDIFDVK